MAYAPLGKKQNIANSDWIEAMDHIEEIISKEAVDERMEKTVKEIKKTIKGKHAALAWSGGKDSIALAKVCEMAGVTDYFLVVCNLEYPAFTKWVEEKGPAGLTIINTGQDMDWLVKHQYMLFPQDSKYAGQWFHIVQHRGQAQYYRDNNLDMLILGRRRADGNYVGNGSNIYTNKQGVTRYSALANWTHEEILGCIHYYGLDMPPIYDWKNGYLCGTHPWPARQWTESEENGWQEVYDIDHSIVENAANYLDGAKKFMDSLK